MGADAVMLGVALARATDAPGPRLPLGPRGAPPEAAPRPPRERRPGRRRSRRSCTARRRSPTAPRTSSGRCASRWRRPDTPTSRSSSASRSSSRRTARDDVRRPSQARRPPAEVFPPTLREVMLRPRWIALLALCLVVAGVFAWLGQWQLGRALQTDPTPARRDRGGAAARRRRPRPASTSPSRSSASASTVDGHVDARGLPHRRVPVQRRRRGVLGHRAAARRGRRGRTQRPISLAVAIGWAADRGRRARRRRPARIGMPPPPAPPTPARRSPVASSPTRDPCCRRAAPTRMTHDAHVAGRAARRSGTTSRALDVYRPYLASEEPPAAARRHLVAGARPKAPASTGSTSSTRSSGRCSPASRSTSGTASPATPGRGKSRSSKMPSRRQILTAAGRRGRAAGRLDTCPAPRNSPRSRRSAER